MGTRFNDVLSGLGRPNSNVNDRAALNVAPTQAPATASSKLAAALPKLSIADLDAIYQALRVENDSATLSIGIVPREVLLAVEPAFRALLKAKGITGSPAQRAEFDAGTGKYLDAQGKEATPPPTATTTADVVATTQSGGGITSMLTQQWYGFPVWLWGVWGIGAAVLGTWAYSKYVKPGVGAVNGVGELDDYADASYQAQHALPADSLAGAPKRKRKARKSKRAAQKED